jgi:hypothetical protein
MVTDIKQSVDTATGMAGVGVGGIISGVNRVL